MGATCSKPSQASQVDLAIIDAYAKKNHKMPDEITPEMMAQINECAKLEESGDAFLHALVHYSEYVSLDKLISLAQGFEEKPGDKIRVLTSNEAKACYKLAGMHGPTFGDLKDLNIDQIQKRICENAQEYYNQDSGRYYFLNLLDDDVLEAFANLDQKCYSTPNGPTIVDLIKLEDLAMLKAVTSDGALVCYKSDFGPNFVEFNPNEQDIALEEVKQLISPKALQGYIQIGGFRGVNEKLQSFNPQSVVCNENVKAILTYGNGKKLGIVTVTAV